MNKRVPRVLKVSEKAAAAAAFGACSDEEREQLMNDFGALRVDRMRAFLKEKSVQAAGSKEVMTQRLRNALQGGRVALRDLVAFLDQEAAWGKQHVYLLGTPVPDPDSSVEQWSDAQWLRSHLAAHRVSNRLGTHLPLILPDRLSLASIDATEQSIRVTAIQRREGWERVEELDGHKEDDQGQEIEMRAFRRVVTRGLVAFEWNFQTNTAILQISQLPAHHQYDDARKDFRLLTKSWLPVERFPVISLAKAIGTLYVTAKDPTNRLRAHGVEFEATDGRRLTGRSQRAEQRLQGNTIIDGALDSMKAAKSLGKNGNFFFVSESEVDDVLSADDTHVLLVAGKKNRINFTSPENEEKIRDVLQRIRAAC